MPHRVCPYGARLGLILAILGAFTVFESLTIDTEDGARIGDIAWKPLSISVGSVILFGITLPWLGMFIALPLLVLDIRIPLRAHGLRLDFLPSNPPSHEVNAADPDRIECSACRIAFHNRTTTGNEGAEEWSLPDPTAA